MKIFGAILLLLLALIAPAVAQNPQTVKLCVPTSGTTCASVTATAPLPVSGTFSATLAGFTPNGNYTTLTATASSSTSTALPAGVVVAFQNLSTVDVSCVLAAGAATATINKLVVRAAATVFYTVGANDHAACINQTGSASNLVGLAGGAGLGTNFGGGGSGGGAITIASGGVASGAYASGSIATGAMVDVTTNGATTAHTCSVVGYSVLGCLGQIDDDIKGPISAGANLIGSIMGPTADGSAAANPPVLVAGTTDGTATGLVAIPKVSAGGVVSVDASAGTAPVLVAGTARVGYTSDDPCTQKIKLNAPFTTTSGGPVSIVALSGSTVVYICSISAITDTAIKLSFIDGTGGSCAAAQHAIWGSTTAANGMSLAANGGFTMGSGNGSVGVTTAASAFCLLQSGTSLVAGNVTYVQQ